jgi:hypothetical protein
MKKPRTLKEFGKELRKLINSGQVFALLKEGDWGAGGCWTLGEALAEYLGPPAEILVVSERREGGGGGDIDVPVSHVVVKYADLYIDYNGAQTEKQLLKSLEKEGYDYPELNDFSEDLKEYAHGQWGMKCDLGVKKELLKHLRRRFGT